MSWDESDVRLVPVEWLKAHEEIKQVDEVKQEKVAESLPEPAKTEEKNSSKQTKSRSTKKSTPKKKPAKKDAGGKKDEKYFRKVFPAKDRS